MWSGLNKNKRRKTLKMKFIHFTIIEDNGSKNIMYNLKDLSLLQICESQESSFLIFGFDEEILSGGVANHKIDEFFEFMKNAKRYFYIHFDNR